MDLINISDTKTIVIIKFQCYIYNYERFFTIKILKI